MAIIKINNLIKYFKSAKKIVKAVDGINLEIKEGEIFGLLGPNGAGKTTIISILSTILKKNKGSVFLNGYNIDTQKEKIRKLIGVVFQETTLDLDLTAYDNLDFHARVYRVDNKDKKIDEALKLVGLYERKNDIVFTFSGGMKRKLEIARGLLHTPKILILDEPTLGLDPQTRYKIWEYIKKLNQKEKITIILTTHYMDEADKLCNRVAIIDKGKIVTIGKPEKLKKVVGDDIIEIVTNESHKLKAKLKRSKFIKKIEGHNKKIWLTVQKGENLIPKLSRMANIESILLHKPTLDDVFLYYTGKTIDEADIKK